MLSRNLFAGVVSVVVSASLLVVVVDPAGAVEAVPSSDSLPQVVGADSPSVVVPGGPVFFAIAGPAGKGLKALSSISRVDELKFGGIVEKFEIFNLARDARKYDKE